MSAFVPVFFVMVSLCQFCLSILSFYLSCAITNLFNQLILLSKQQVSKNIILMFDFLLGHIICQVGHRSCQEVNFWLFLFETLEIKRKEKQQNIKIISFFRTPYVRHLGRDFKNPILTILKTNSEFLMLKF
jgi:hypothetical protein